MSTAATVPLMIDITTSDRVRTIVLQRPEALNALTPSLLEALVEALEAASQDEGIDVVVLTGAGRAFCAGVDLKALAAGGVDGGDVSESLNRPARRATELLATMSKITVAKVNGACFTGGLEIALACDLMIVADEAKMGDTHTKWGLRPTWGMSQRLVQAVGITRARWLSYTSRTFSGIEAAAWGIACESAPLADLDTRTEQLVSALIENSAPAQRAYKDLYLNAQNHLLSEGLLFEYGAQYPLKGAGDRLKTFGG